MSVSMRWEQCCESEDCNRPAHYGVLCAACFRAATPARRVVELDNPRVDPLEALWSLPAVQPATPARRVVEAAGSGVDALEALWSLPVTECGDA